MQIDPQKETVERVRRIETRITKIGQHFGIDVGGGVPVWSPANNRVIVPSRNCSIGEILKAVPREFDGEVDVFVATDYLVTMFVDQP